MKWHSILLVCCFLVTIGTSCQRELYFDPVASGYLITDSGMHCSIQQINGLYYQDTACTSSNTVIASIYASSAGPYRIVSDTVNGFYFEGLGRADSIGRHLVKLQGKGTPINPGTSNFTLRYGSSTCSFSVDISTITAIANYDYLSSGNDCSGAVVSGFCKRGVPLNSSNRVTVKVNVIQVGIYNISTLPINGIRYAAAGVFTQTGVQTVNLYGEGTPIQEGDVSFSIGSLNSSCGFVITVYPPFNGLGAFTLSAASGSACNGMVANGNYQVGTTLTSNNTVTMQVNVISPGGYSVHTDTVNGIWFSSFGVFTSTGPQSIILKGSGLPVQSGDFNFTTTALSGYCMFTITVQPITNFATFQLSGSPGNCGAATIVGIYQAGVPVSGNNQVRLGVNVSLPGFYSIVTNVSNGFSFSGSGIFLVTGIQTVTLNASGTPLTQGAFTYNAITGSSTGASNCGFTVVTQ